MDRTRTFLIVLVISAVPFAVVTTLLLTSAFGSTDFGLRCARNSQGDECEVLQSRFLGLSDSRSFAIPQSDILGAKTLCSSSGRSGANCTVNLLLKSGPYRVYPVLSYPLFDSADASTRKLNAYLNDATATSIEMKDDFTTIMIFAVAPLLIVLVVLALRRLWSRPKHIDTSGLGA